MQPFVRGGGTGGAVPGSAVGESKAQGDGKDGHRSELRRRPYAGPSAYALLRALRALRNPTFSRRFRLRRCEPLHSHPIPRSPDSHPLGVEIAPSTSSSGVAEMGPLGFGLYPNCVPAIS